MGFWTPEEKLETGRLRSGLRALTVDHVFSQSMVSLTGGAFMVAMVLAIGGDNQTVGLIAAIGPIAQVAQIAAVLVVQKVGRRRALTVFAAILARSVFLFIAAIPFVLPGVLQVPALLLAIVVHQLLNSLAGCAYGSWVRDVIPESLMGRYMGRRLACAIAAGAVLSLAAGAGVTWWAKGHAEGPAPYSVLFAVGAVLGMFGSWGLRKVPEPRMVQQAKVSPWAMLVEPLCDKRFRMVLRFFGTWAFAVNMAAPFFAVYMLQKLGLSLGVVVTLSVMSQLVNVAFFPIWGRLADRFNNKAVLATSGLMLVFSFLAWPLMTLGVEPGQPMGWYWATWPLLIAVHLLMGVATAGTALAAGNLALKAAPKGQATAYLATNALISGVCASLAPLLAGPFADYFSERRLTISLRWTTPEALEPFVMPAFDLQGLDYLFILAFIFGLYSLHRLTAVKEEGEVSERVILRELRVAVRRGFFSITGPLGVRQILAIPTGQFLSGAKRQRAQVEPEEKPAPEPSE